jgi:Ca2+-binding RTX toxin-like protein
MANFQVLNGTGLNGNGVQFGSISQIASSGIAGFPVITPTSGSIFYNDTGLISLTGIGMSFIFPSTFGGTLTSLTYSRPAVTPIFSITALSAPLNDVTGLLLPGGNELAALATMFSGDDTIGGSSLDDLLMGFSGDDAVNGGEGSDTLIGGAGSDALNGGDGSDWASYSGSANEVFVDLQSGLVFSGDATGDTLTDIENVRGSAFGDVLTGNAGSNHLHDGGFGAADTLTGGGGSDTYSVYNTGATIVEVAGAGLDRVNAGVNYVLASGVSAEYLNTTSLHATYAVNLTGNELIQLIRGNDGANVLDGAGGNDVLWGMGGTDTFSFSTVLGVGNIDRIEDFDVTDDQVQLSSAIFSTLSVGGLDATAFKDTAFAPKDADDRIIYNSDTGALCYDADGSGTAFGNVRLATLTGSPVLTAADFVVV